MVLFPIILTYWCNNPIHAFPHMRNTVFKCMKLALLFTDANNQDYRIAYSVTVIKK